RKPSFAQRVEPQLRSLDSRSRLLAGEGSGSLFGPLERIFRLVLSDAVHRLGRFNVSVRGLGARLEQAGRSESPLEFRAMQFLCAAAGLLVGVVAAILLLWQGTINFMGAVVLALGPMVGGYLFYDYLLGARIK